MNQVNVWILQQRHSGVNWDFADTLVTLLNVLFVAHSWLCFSSFDFNKWLQHHSSRSSECFFKLRVMHVFAHMAQQQYRHQVCAGQGLTWNNTQFVKPHSEASLLSLWLCWFSWRQKWTCSECSATLSANTSKHWGFWSLVKVTVVSFITS